MKCGYALRGLPEHRCPECGQVFDPADGTTFQTYAIAIGVGHRYLRIVLWGWGAAFLAVLLVSANGFVPDVAGLLLVLCSLLLLAGAWFCELAMLISGVAALCDRWSLYDDKPILWLATLLASMTLVVLPVAGAAYAGLAM